MKLHRTILAATALCALIAESAYAQDISLTFLTFETPNLTPQYWDKAIADTSAKVPGVTIKKLVAPNADRNAFARQLDSTGQLPDIMVAVSPSGLAEAGKLAEFSVDELADWINPTSNSYGGKIYQLPTNTQTIPMVYYQKADFAKAGIAAPPKKWEEFLADCQKLKDTGFTPLNVGGGGADTWADLYVLKAVVATDVYAKDPDWLSKLVAGKTNFHDPLFLKAVGKIKNLVDKGYIDSRLLSNDYPATQAAFLANKAAMYPMGSWFTVAPDATQQAQIGVFPWPTDDGKLVVSAFTGGGLSVSAKAPDVAKAKQWAIAFSTLKSNEDAGVRNDALFIALKDYSVPADIAPLYQMTLDRYNEALRSGTVTNTFLEEQGVPAVPAGFSDEVAAAMGDLINGRKDVEAFVTYLDGKMTELQK
jgi:ABC-type glycerol-3-phosphate transport system substrate-binding protein